MQGMKRVLLILTVIALAAFLAGCSGGSTSSTTTSSTLSTGDTTTSGLDQTSDTVAPEDTSSTVGDGTDTTAGDTGTTLASDDNTTTTLAAGSTSQTVDHQQSEARLSYSGTWKTVSSSSASGGSLALANTSGATLTIRFVGTQLTWIGKESPAYGKASVTVDGGTAHTVDLYASATTWKHIIWKTGTLKKDAHTVVISWTGKKRTEATGTNIDVDSIQVTGVLTGRYQQSNTKFTYSGTWKTVSDTAASGGGFAYANASGASVTIHFTGIDLAWIAKKGPGYGQAKITVDGAKTYTVNLYSASVVWQKRVWSTGILASGSHTVKIQWTGSKSSKATGTNIDVDAFDVTGTLK
jgi:hypothetical protein